MLSPGLAEYFRLCRSSDAAMPTDASAWDTLTIKEESQEGTSDRQEYEVIVKCKYPSSTMGSVWYNNVPLKKAISS